MENHIVSMPALDAALVPGLDAARERTSSTGRRAATAVLGDAAPSAAIDPRPRGTLV